MHARMLHHFPTSGSLPYCYFDYMLLWSDNVMTAHTVAALHAIVLDIALKYELHAQYLHILSEARGEQTASLAILW